MTGSTCAKCGNKRLITIPCGHCEQAEERRVIGMPPELGMPYGKKAGTAEWGNPYEDAANLMAETQRNALAQAISAALGDVRELSTVVFIFNPKTQLPDSGIRIVPIVATGPTTALPPNLVSAIQSAGAAIDEFIKQSETPQGFSLDRVEMVTPGRIVRQGKTSDVKPEDKGEPVLSNVQRNFARACTPDGSLGHMMALDRTLRHMISSEVASQSPDRTRRRLESVHNDVSLALDDWPCGDAHDAALRFSRLRNGVPNFWKAYARSINMPAKD